MTTTATSIPHRAATARLARALWRAARQFAYGVDAASALAHGREVPPGHRSRRRRTVPHR